MKDTSLKKYGTNDGVTSRKKKYEELTISDSFIFFVVMQNEKLCKKMLETILDIEIEKIEYLAAEKQIKNVYDGKGIRLDVYVKDDKKTIYNLEMQVANVDNIPKRTRYYQSMIDKNLLLAGEAYDELNESIVIFICRFDMFGYGEAKYTFKNMCKEIQNLELGDETTKLFVNSKAILDKCNAEELHISDELLNVLRYIETGQICDEFTKLLEEEVEKVKKDSDWRETYMLYELKIQEAERRGEKRGAKRREELTAKLYVKLIEDERYEEAKKAGEDPEYREQLFKEYGLIEMEDCK